MSDTTNAKVTMSRARWRALAAIVQSAATMMDSGIHKHLANTLVEDITTQAGVSLDPIKLEDL